MDNSTKAKCHAIIHAASAAAAGVGGGLANLPGSDAPVLVTIQVGMIISLAKVFDKSLTEASAKSMLTEFVGVSVGKVVANVLTGWLPGIGNGINAATAASVTEFIGWQVAEEFDKES